MVWGISWKLNWVRSLNFDFLRHLERCGPRISAAECSTEIPRRRKPPAHKARNKEKNIKTHITPPTPPAASHPAP